MYHSGNEKEVNVEGRSYLFSRWPEVEGGGINADEGSCEFEDISNLEPL